MITAEQYLAQTNARLQRWYDGVYFDYLVMGEAHATIIGEDIIINYTENGVKKVWSMCFYVDNQEELNYYFNVWAEQAH